MRENLLAVAHQLMLRYDDVDCYSVKGDGEATHDCDVAIDSARDTPINRLNDSIIRYWTEQVPYNKSLTRHKFCVATDVLQD